jgi:hypothetical protein
MQIPGVRSVARASWRASLVPLVAAALAGATAHSGVLLAEPVSEAAGRCAQPSFRRVSSLTTGARPFALAVADVDGDGQPDLMVANMSSNEVALLPGRPDGSFGEPRRLAGGSLPVSVGVADFDRDGRLDLAMVNAGSNDVSVLVGAGGGVFSAPTTVAAEALPVAVAVGDVDGDGDLDLVVANYGDDNVAVLLWGEGGAFRPAPGSPVAVGEEPEALALADLDGDGRLDVAVAATGLDSLALLLGNGDGSFRWGDAYPVGKRPRHVVVADFNADGWPDLAVTNKDSGSVSVLVGLGGGRFAPSRGSPMSVGTGPEGLAVADLNADGSLDLAIALTDTAPDNLAILLGRGDGTFQAPVYFSAGLGPWAVAVADFDGDGAPDLAVTNVNANQISILLNQCGDGRASLVDQRAALARFAGYDVHR